MRTTWRLARALATVGLLCVGIAACGSSSSSSSTSASSANTTTSTASSNSGSSGTTAAAAKPTGSPIHIEAISFTIPGLDFLTPIYAGAQAAAVTINNEGGIDGHPVVIDKCNSMLTPAGSTTCAHTTIANHPVAELGCDPFWASTGNPLYAAQGIPSFNCADSFADYQSNWEFSADALEMNAAARYICTLSNVKSVVFTSSADPIVEKEVPPQITKIFSGCGKTVSTVFFPLTTVDMAPYVQKILAAKPGFVMMQVGGAQYLQLMKGFQTAGWPADKVSVDSGTIDYTNILTPGGAALNGTYFVSWTDNWDDTTNPDVAAYLKATAHLPDPKQSNTEASYAEAMWIYQAAKAAGSGNFSASTLTHYMRTANGVPIFLSKTMSNPGQKGFPAIKNPDELILQWKNGTMTTVTQGTSDGWISGAPS